MRLFYWIIAVATAAVLTSCSNITEQEKTYILEQAEKGDHESLARVVCLREDFDYVFDQKTRSKYEQIGLENGVKPIIDNKIAMSETDSERIKWLKFGVKKGIGAHAYRLAEIYKADGDSIKEREFYVQADELGYPMARLSLEKMDGATGSLTENIFATYRTEKLYANASWLGKNVKAMFATSKEMLMAVLTVFFRPEAGLWWKVLLTYLGFLGVYIALMYYWPSFDRKLGQGNLSLAWIPWLFTLYGVYSAATSGSCREIWLNIGRLTPVEGTFGNLTLLSVIPTWIVLLSALYALGVALFSSRSVGLGIVRFLSVAALSVYGFVAGVSALVLVVVLFVIAMLKGHTANSFVNSTSSSGNSGSGSGRSYIDCPHKTISGGCSLNNGYSCRAQSNGGDCPYGVKII